MTNHGKLLAAAVSFVMGAALFAASLYVIVKDVHIAGMAHSTNAWFAGFGIVLALLLILPAQTMAAAKFILDTVGPYLPEIRIGGRRKTDPPLPPPEPTPSPDAPPSGLEGQ